MLEGSMKRAQCQAWAEVSGQRCKKTIRRGHRYCWSHQGKLPYLVTAIAGAIISFAVSTLGHRFVPTTESRQLESLNRKPVFKAFLNGKSLTAETDVSVPVGSGVAVLQFSL